MECCPPTPKWPLILLLSRHPIQQPVLDVLWSSNLGLKVRQRLAKVNQTRSFDHVARPVRANGLGQIPGGVRGAAGSFFSGRLRKCFILPHQIFFWFGLAGANLGTENLGVEFRSHPQGRSSGSQPAARALFTFCVVFLSLPMTSPIPAEPQLARPMKDVIAGWIYAAICEARKICGCCW